MASIDWDTLDEVFPLDAVNGSDSGFSCAIDVNSGGQLFVCFFRPSHDKEAPRELCLVKCGRSRCEMQAEYLAQELARHLQIKTPVTRLLRKGVGSGESPSVEQKDWRGLWKCVQRLKGPGAVRLLECLDETPCLLLMEFIPTAPCPEVGKCKTPEGGTTSIAGFH